MLHNSAANLELRQDGKFRRLEVRVDRPGVEVRARNGYQSEKPEAAMKRKSELASRPLGAALAGILPKSDLPLQLTAVPFAVPGKKEAGVAVILGVRQPIRDTGTRTVEKVDLVVRAFDTNGKQFGATNLRADVTIRADASGLEYEVLSRIDLKPGRYSCERPPMSVARYRQSLLRRRHADFWIRRFRSRRGAELTGRAHRGAARSKDPHSVVPTTSAPFVRRPGVGVSSHLSGRQQAVNAVPLRISRNDADVLVFDRREEVGAATFSTRARGRSQCGAAARA